MGFSLNATQVGQSFGHFSNDFDASDDWNSDDTSVDNCNFMSPDDAADIFVGSIIAGAGTVLGERIGKELGDRIFGDEDNEDDDDED